MCLVREFEVQVSKAEVIAAALPLQDHWLPLSNLDLLLPPVDFGVFFCYKHNPTQLPFALLKKALAQTLVTYYPFSGELVKNRAGEPELHCNNGGVDFVEAVADDVDLEDINFYNPDESVQGKLVPERKRGVLAVQATQVKDGVVVACTFAHQVADAYSANMFLVSWAETAQSKPLSQPPSFRRSLLLPRRPGRYHSSVDHMYVPVSALPPPPPQDDNNNNAALSRIYYIKANHVEELQELANLGNGEGKRRRTKLEAFCAFLWKMVVSADHVSGGDSYCRLGVVVDGRYRLIDRISKDRICNEINGDEKEAKLIASYFGNVLSIPFGEKKIEELKEKPLNWVAEEVHHFMQSAVKKEHFLGLIDWVEEHRPQMGLSRIYAAGGTEAAVVVSSGLHFPVGKMDFGWGKPVFGSYHFPWGGKSGYVMPMPSPKGNGDWVVYMHLLKGQLDLIEANAAHVFNPLTSSYLFSFN